ncbi:MAG: hypothetical protein IPN96_14525 [Anaerolineales bacterium]|nr:hypothetical protein [Anaerolineales bacterium]
MKLTPPTPEEYAPYYGAYVGPATARGDVLAALPKQIDEVERRPRPVDRRTGAF